MIWGQLNLHSIKKLPCPITPPLRARSLSFQEDEATDLPRFLVLLLLQFLLLFLCLDSRLVIHQWLVPLRQEGKMNLPVAPLDQLVAVLLLRRPSVLVSRVTRALLVHMSLIPSCLCAQSLSRCWMSVKQHWGNGFGLHGDCQPVAGLGGCSTTPKKKKVALSPQEARYAVNRCYVHEWKCIPAGRLVCRIWHRALKGAKSCLLTRPTSISLRVSCSALHCRLKSKWLLSRE